MPVRNLLFKLIFLKLFSPFSQKEKEVFGIQNSIMGIWDIGQCPKGLHFDAIQQKCTEKIGINEANGEIKIQNSDGVMTTMKMPLLYFNGPNGGKGCYPQCLGQYLIINLFYLIFRRI